MITDFNYWLTGRGWAEAFFTSERQNISFEVSYISDPLAELFEGFLKIIKGHSEREKTVFLDEPGQHILIISKQKAGVISVEILMSHTYDEMGNKNKIPENVETVFSDTDTLNNFASVVCTGIESLLGRHTLSDYKEKWHTYDFPAESFNELKQIVNLM